MYCLRQTSKFHHQASFQKSQFVNMPFPSFPGPLYQNEVKCSAFDMKMIFHSHANKTYFHKKGCALSLILKVRVLGIRKWPIDLKRILIHKESKCKESCSQTTLGGEICSFDVNTHKGHCLIRISLQVALVLFALFEFMPGTGSVLCRIALWVCFQGTDSDPLFRATS